MPNGRVDDQHCLRKIRSFLDFNLNRFSFSDSDLHYLNAPLSSPKVSDHLKEKYLNFYRVSMQIYDLKNRTSAKSKRSFAASRSSDRRNPEQKPTSSPKSVPGLTDRSMAGRPIGQLKGCSVRAGHSPELSKSVSTENCSTGPGRPGGSPVFDIDKIHNYRDNQSLISSSSGNLSDLGSFDSSQSSLNKLHSSRVFQTNASNLTIYRHLTRSDPELYSTNLLSCGDTDGDTRDKQLFYLKTIYLSFKSLNLLEKFCVFKRRTASFLASIKPEVCVLSDKEDKKDFADKMTVLSDLKLIGENEEVKQPSDRATGTAKPDGEGRNEQSAPKIETRRDNPAEPADSDRINLDKVISCVDLRTKHFREKKEDERRTDFDRNGLDHFLSSDKFDTKTILGKIESLNNFDPIFHHPKASDQQMKPVRASSELFSSLFRLDLFDNFVTRTISNKLPAFSLKPKTPTQDKNCSCKKSADHAMDVIDLNDANNYKYYKDSIFDSFDLDVDDEQAIRLEFDQKFETFLQEDLRKLGNELRLQSSIDSSARQSEASQLSSSRPGSGGTTNESGKSKQFDSIKRLSSFQSRIPVLQRDKSKFSKAMMDKLKIKYDPLNIKKRSKELIQVLDEDYKSLGSARSKKTPECRRNLDRRGARNVGSIDKLNNRNRHRESNEATPGKNIESIKSLKTIRPPVKSMKRLDSLRPLKENVRDRPGSSTLFTSRRPSRIPRFMYERPKDGQLLLNRKNEPTETGSKPGGQKFDKFFHLIKETTGLFRGTATKWEQRPGEDLTNENRMNESGQQDYQRLKRCVPRTKSESFLSEQLDSYRINENYRNRLLDLELKTNGNCLFQLYDYFEDFKDRRRDRK